MGGRISLFASVLILAASVGVGAALGEPAGVSENRATDNVNPRSASLKAFGTCRGLLGYARRHGAVREGTDPVPMPGVLMPSAVAAPEARGPDDAEFSQTNVQETGIDEPDLVKTDGSHIYALTEDRLHVVRTGTEKMSSVGFLALSPGDERIWDPQMLLAGERLVVLANSSDGALLIEIDISRPGAIREVSRMTVEGSLIDARMSDGTARVVISAYPDYEVVSDDDGTSVDPAPTPPTPVTAAPRKPKPNRALPRGPEWMPDAVLRTKRGKVTRGKIAPCRKVRRPGGFSGLGMLTVLTIDLGKGLAPVDSDAVMTYGDVVYASPESLYVATERWLGYGAGEEARSSQVFSEIHRFDASSRGATTYRASGRVPGYMLSQWSMSEREGFLRVATTTQPASGSGGGESQSLLTVLETRGRDLAQVGQVDGLGRGERIYAVRFIGDAGFVVTFRETDPLYTLDLSEPSDPRVLGELKVPGYSAYLHPVGDGLLLGIGQDATEEGVTQGTQISLFDVSELRRPRSLHRERVASGARSAVEFDSHAFLYWSPAKLAVMPIEITDEIGRGRFAGAIGFRAGPGAGVGPVTRLSHGQQAEIPILRALVIGDRLYTMSDRGLMTSDVRTLAKTDWLPFPASAVGGGQVKPSPSEPGMGGCEGQSAPCEMVPRHLR